MKYKLRLPKGLKPMPFQKGGVALTIDFDNRALIADAMGLGKTIQAICWLNCQPWMRPALIIVPATAKIKWTRTLIEWMARLDDNIIMLSGMQAKKQLPEQPSIVVCNYDILKDHKKRKPAKRQTKKRTKHLYHALKQIRFKAVVIDECHYLANVKSQRTKIISYITNSIRNILALSGTPIPSRPEQFFPILNILKPGLFSNIWSFRHRYCGAKRGYGGRWDFSGASNTKKLHQILVDNVMIRRTKKEVIKDLPPKLRSVEPIEIDNREEYEEAERDFIAWLQKKGKYVQAKKAKKSTALARIEGLKQLCLKGKTKGTIEWIQNFLDGGGEKLVVFCHHVAFRKMLYKHFKKVAVEAPGGAANQMAEDVFQTNPKIKLIIGGIKSANVNMTLTAASHMYIIELPWTSIDLEQAEERIYARLNDVHGAMIYFGIAENTIEEEIAALLDIKSKVLSKVLDGKEIDEGTLLTKLLKIYKRRK